MKKKEPRTGKNIRLFLNSEEGKMLDADIVKTGLALGIIGAAMADQANAAAISFHTNAFNETSHTSHLSHGSHGSHGSHASHGSHGSHGSHSRGGWC